jgi:hypothetical protein
MGDREITIRISKLSDQGAEADVDLATATQRVAMMWQLTLDAWAFRGDHSAESRLPRHVIRVVRQ